MTTKRVMENNARIRYLGRWRPAAKHADKAAGLEVPLVELVDPEHIAALSALADLEEGTSEHADAVKEHHGRMRFVHQSMLDAEEAASNYRRQRNEDMMALALLGWRPAKIAEECKVGPMVTARAIGTSARGAAG